MNTNDFVTLYDYAVGNCFVFFPINKNGRAIGSQERTEVVVLRSGLKERQRGGFENLILMNLEENINTDFDQISICIG